MSRPPSTGSAVIRQQASDWIARRDAGLSPAEEREFRSWREADPRHAAALGRYERLWSRLDDPRAAGAAPQLNRDLALLAQRSRRRRARWTGSAALAALVVAAAGWWSVKPIPTAQTLAPTSFAVLVPERRVLADGTVVEYPAGSAITIDFSSPRVRRVTLVRGEAHFQVAPNRARPFVVDTAGVEVRAVGTGFSVQRARSGVEVIVTEGRVAVASGAASSSDATAATAVESGGPTMLHAGQRLSIVAEPERATATAGVPRVAEAISAVEIAQRLAWRSPRMEFSNTPLRDVIAAINRYGVEHGGMRFVLEDSAVGERRLSGIFRVDDISAFIGILEKGFGIEAERSGAQTVVLRGAR